MPFQVMTNIMMSLVAATDALLILLLAKETSLELFTDCRTRRENPSFSLWCRKRDQEHLENIFLIHNVYSLDPFPYIDFLQPPTLKFLWLLVIMSIADISKAPTMCKSLYYLISHCFCYVDTYQLLLFTCFKDDKANIQTLTFAENHRWLKPKFEI